MSPAPGEEGALAVMAALLLAVIIGAFGLSVAGMQTRGADIAALFPEKERYSAWGLADAGGDIAAGLVDGQCVPVTPIHRAVNDQGTVLGTVDITVTNEGQTGTGKTILLARSTGTDPSGSAVERECELLCQKEAATCPADPLPEECVGSGDREVSVVDCQGG